MKCCEYCELTRGQADWYCVTVHFCMRAVDNLCFLLHPLHMHPNVVLQLHTATLLWLMLLPRAYLVEQLASMMSAVCLVLQQMCQLPEWQLFAQPCGRPALTSMIHLLRHCQATDHNRSLQKVKTALT